LKRVATLDDDDAVHMEALEVPSEELDAPPNPIVLHSYSKPASKLIRMYAYQRCY